MEKKLGQKICFKVQQVNPSLPKDTFFKETVSDLNLKAVAQTHRPSSPSQYIPVTLIAGCPLIQDQGEQLRESGLHAQL